MRNVQALEPQEQRSRDGTPSAGDLQPRPEVGIPSSAVNVPKAPGGKRGGGRITPGVVGKVYTKKGPKPRLNTAMFALAIAELVEGPTTRAELADHTGLHWHTVNLLITALHRKGLIHICGWDKDSMGKSQIAVFQFGRKKDAPKPAPKTRAENIRAYRDRKAKKAALMASAGVPMQMGA